MVKIINEFSEFMNSEFQSISMGFTPSGFIHLGFLTTLACAFMYIKRHPNTKLIITNIENSLSCKWDKYGNYPLRFQTLTDSGLNLPSSFEELKKREIVTKQVHNEVINLIWKLVHTFDQKTTEEITEINKKNIDENTRKLLLQKENKIFHYFHSQIHIYSFLHILDSHKRFRKEVFRYLMNPEFASLVTPILTGTDGEIKDYENKVYSDNRQYYPKQFQIPVRLYCPTCKQLCPDWGKVIIGHPKLREPTIYSICKNPDCEKGQNEDREQKKIFIKFIKQDIQFLEFHFMLDPIRDFIEPFKTDCHLFGGDYFLLEYEKSGLKAIDKLNQMFEYLEKKTEQEKAFFGGPLIVMEGKKMSKSEEAFNIKDIDNLKRVFLNIMERLEKFEKDYDEANVLEYSELLKKVA